MSPPYDFLNKYVFSDFLKYVTEGEFLIFSGRLFHNLAALETKALSPNEVLFI